MKKKSRPYTRSCEASKLFFRKMRLTILILLICMIQASASVFSQTARLSFSLQEKTVLDVLRKIEDQTDYRFFYQREQVNVDRMITIQATDKSVGEILTTVFKDQGITFKMMDDNLIVLTTTSDLPQSKLKVKGVITNSSGDPIPGVAIMEKGTSNGIVTDANGKFTLDNVLADAVLVVSFVGMKTQEIAINGRSEINIEMAEDLVGVAEVVVIGYGTLDKKEVTSSITSVRDKDLIPGISGNPLISMQGKVAGLSIESSNGTSPNAGTSVQLRGVASVLAGQGPLVVIDGVPGGSLSSVSREDIQSIDILKDASAGAIYGTRAAGGVILITTKQAKEGNIRLTYTGEFTTETIRRKPEVLSAQEFVENGLGKDNGYVTDWYREVTEKLPFRHRHHFNLSGGSKTSKIYATFLTSSQEGIAIGDTKKETGGRVNANFTLMDGRAEIIAHTDYRTSNSDKSQNGIFNMALKLNPTLSPYDETKANGLNVWTGGWEYYNPVADIRLRDDQSQNSNFLGDVTFKLKLSPALSTQAMLAARSNQNRDIYYESAQHKNSLDNKRDGYASQGYSTYNDKTFEWLVNYRNQFDGHTVSAVGGYSFQEFNADGFSMNNSNFPVDGIKAWDMGKGKYLSEGKAGMSSWKDPQIRLIAFFARANYSYKDKYLFSISSRYEGSSKFYVDNRWGLFPAVSAGWRISKEPFMKSVSMVDDLKIRIGYGVTGNQSFSPGVATRMYQSDTWWMVNNDWIITYGSRHNQNKDLKWEEKQELNIGLDFSLLKNKLSGKIDLYDRKVDKMIYDISVSVPPAVHDKTTMNVGSLRNKGWEAEINYNAINTSVFGYNTTLRMSHNKSVLESLWGSQTYWDRVGFPAPGSPGSAVRLFPGQEIGKFYVWRFAGFTEDGNWMLYDKEGNAFDVTKQTKKNEDKAFVGNAIPKIMLSWDHNFRWRNFEVSAFFTSWLGHDIFNTIDMYYGLPNVEEQNVLKHAFEKNKNVKGEKELCDYWIEDGDFIKLKALTIRYNINTSSLKYIRSANVYLTGRDLFTITKYSGMDPESNINGLDPGFEWHNNIYPRTRLFTLGVQLTF